MASFATLWLSVTILPPNLVRIQKHQLINSHNHFFEELACLLDHHHYCHRKSLLHVVAVVGHSLKWKCKVWILGVAAPTNGCLEASRAHLQTSISLQCCPGPNIAESSGCGRDHRTYAMLGPGTTVYGANLNGAWHYTPTTFMITPISFNNEGEL